MRQAYTANLNESKERKVISQFSPGTSESGADERYLFYEGDEIVLVRYSAEGRYHHRLGVLTLKPAF